MTNFIVPSAVAARTQNSHFCSIKKDSGIVVFVRIEYPRCFMATTSLSLGEVPTHLAEGEMQALQGEIVKDYSFDNLLTASDQEGRSARIESHRGPLGTYEILTALRCRLGGESSAISFCL